MIKPIANSTFSFYKIFVLFFIEILFKLYIFPADFVLKIVDNQAALVFIIEYNNSEYLKCSMNQEYLYQLVAL